MKKFLPFLLVAALLTGCVLPVSTTEPQVVQPTLSDADMQTQLAMMLTAMPTQTDMPEVIPSSTPGPVLVTATPGAVEPTNTQLPAPTLTPEVLQATATTAPTQAPTATTGPAFTAVPGDPRGRQGAASSTDPMNDSTTWVWPEGANEFSSISFSGGFMNLTSLSEKIGWRLANPEGTDLGNLYLEATFKTAGCSGNDQYGVIVRVPVLRDADQGYLFAFTCDGRYSLRKWDGKEGANGKMTRLKDWTSSDAIQQGSNQINRMGLMMIGSKMVMYANGQLLAEVTDGTWTSGYFGVFVGSGPTEKFLVQVDEMSYWKNPNP